MNRIFADYVYDEGPREGCWWDRTCELPDVPKVEGNLDCDIAILGAGFTGLNAALELARNGKSVIVLDSHRPGWGASGRNGGFCCLGGSMLDDAALDQMHGKAARLEWRQAERLSVAHVSDFLHISGTDADVHSDGETLLAHRPRYMSNIAAAAESVEENYGVTPQVHSQQELRDLGLNAGFYGGLTIPIGFALNPQKYLATLLGACVDAGARVFSDSPVHHVESAKGTWSAKTGSFDIQAAQVLIATNGYSAEDVPNWLASRYLPVQSSIIVTRPLTQAELSEQGWTSYQMCYDSRNLLHYFHLMPDNRMLFGMRGGLGGRPSSERRAKRQILKEFNEMFPAWREVDVPHYWSGMVCLARDFAPFAGELPDQPGLWSAMCYHGNGVAMGSYTGSIVAKAILGDDDLRPAIMRAPLRKFPLGKARRLLMAPAYLGFKLFDL